MSDSRQAIYFKLVRSGQLSAKEIAVMTYINSYSSFCAPPSLKIMAEAMQMCDRTLRTIINSLVTKGLVVKSYRAFKRVKLELVSLENQAKLIGIAMVKRVLSKSSKSKKKEYDRQNHTIYDRQPDAEPIQNKIIQNKTFQSGLNLIKSLSQSKKDPAIEAARYKDYLLNQGITV